MLISKINDYYEIKLFDNIDIYNPFELQNITAKIYEKITKYTKLNNLIYLDVYPDHNYGIIIILKDYKKTYFKDEIEVKITIRESSNILYKMDYFDIKNKKIKGHIYYYDNNYYLEIIKVLDHSDYLNILEEAEIMYEKSDEIKNKGIKIKV